MKADTQRKKYIGAKIHQKKKDIHIHLSKELRAKTKQKRRSLGPRKGDKVKVMRGQHAGKQAKITVVSIVDRRIFLEGLTRKTARGKEVPIPFHPSNLMLISLVESKERAKIFGAEVFALKATEKTKKETEKTKTEVEKKPKEERGRF